jgi:hypothetical protein
MTKLSEATKLRKEVKQDIDLQFENSLGFRNISGGWASFKFHTFKINSDKTITVKGKLSYGIDGEYKTEESDEYTLVLKKGENLWKIISQDGEEQDEN